MSVLLVLVAHDGRTLQLDVQGQTRVDAVQQALVSVTGISVADQIIMCHGARLDPAKPLAAYKLPVGDPTAAEDQPVFLYHKAYLRPGAAPPPVEPLPILDVTVPGLPSVGLRHPLHAAHSPLIRALPDYEAQFQQQLGEARAFWEASQQRLHKCRQLMSEQEVQARAADAARANVETHYNYIAGMYSTFVDKYVSQHRQHTQLLSQFVSLSAAMETIELPQQLATAKWRVLADLQPHRGKLQEWHDSCSRSHEHFASKVAELESVFQLLRQEVERLFLQAPSVDLDALGSQLNQAEGMIDEQGSIVQVLSKDLLTVRQLVEDVVAQLGGSVGGASLSGAAVHDTCAAVDTMHDNHLQSLLPRVRTCDTTVAEFVLRCADAKGRMTKDVLLQLQGIAAQQSRIRDMKHKLAVFNEVLARQAAAFAELQTATRLPAAYRLALAECARRAAWQEMFAGQANRLAEHCGRITAKEASKRETVRRQLERYLPVDLLARAGLLQEPPHCTVSVPPSESFLLPVTPADLARLPAAIQQAADSAAQPTAATAADAASSSSSRTIAAIAARRRSSGDGGDGQQLPPQIPSPRSAAQGASSSRTAAAAGSAIMPSAVAAASTMGMSTSLSAPKAAAAAAAAIGAAPGDPASNLALENARLRAELAAVLAQQAARELGDESASGGSSSSGSSVARSVVGASLLASTAAGGAGSISLAASTAVGAGQPAAAAAAAAAPDAAGPAGKPYGHGGPAVVPATVAAPLPSVTAALQQVAQEEQQTAAAAANRQALTLAPVQAALAAKDELVAGLEARCKRLASDVASYESRISQLEGQLAARFSSSMQVSQDQQQQQQEQRAEAAAAGEDSSRHGAAAAAATEPMVQSVAPAFALDATQAASFFGPAAFAVPAGRLMPQAGPAAAPAQAVGSPAVAAPQPAEEASRAAAAGVVAEQDVQDVAASVEHASRVSEGAAAAGASKQQTPAVKQQQVQQQEEDVEPKQQPDAGVQQQYGEEQVTVQPVAEVEQEQQAPAAEDRQQLREKVLVQQQQQQQTAVTEQDNNGQPDTQQQEASGEEQQQMHVQVVQTQEQQEALSVDDAQQQPEQEQQPDQQQQFVVAGQPQEHEATAQQESSDAQEQQQQQVPGPEQGDAPVQNSPANEPDHMLQEHHTEQPRAVQQHQQQHPHEAEQGQSDTLETGQASEAASEMEVQDTQALQAEAARSDNAAIFAGDSSSSGDVSSRDVPPSVATVEMPLPLPATTAAAAAASSFLSVSEPDLRAVIVAQPADVEAHQQQTAAAAAAALRRPTRSSSAEPAAAAAALPIPRYSGRHSTDGSSAPAVAAAPAGTSGLTSLLSSSMHFLFHRSSSRGDSSSSNSNASPVVSPPAVSPPMSPPARSSPVAAAAAAEIAAADTASGDMDTGMV